MRENNQDKDKAWARESAMLWWSVVCGVVMYCVMVLLGGCGAVPGALVPQPSSCLQHEDCGEQGLCRLGICVTLGESSLENQGEQTIPEGIEESISPELSDGGEQGGRCQPGAKQACFKGDALLRGKGICHEGTQTCQTDGSWGECTGEGTPTEELCNNLDDNCDGQIDEDIRISCYGGAANTRNVGECRSGIQRCINGKLSGCDGQVQPDVEMCGDGLDNNCDGKIDEGCTCTPKETQPCGSQVGECKQGTQTCQSDNTWGTCQNATPPKPEVCDGKDNNCNGQIDEGFDDLGVQCTAGAGHCENKGTRVCAASGKETVCSVTSKPATTELCNHLDDDCDGKIDNIAQTPCPIPGKLGECAKGTATCEQGKAVCIAAQPQGIGELCDGKDNDCDGQIDQKLDRPCYLGPAGTDKHLPCRQGAETCSNGRWGPCNGQITPKAEICDGQDNNCNGLVDEGITCQCTNGQKRLCGTNVGTCKEGMQTCSNGNWGPCTGQTAPTPEICDNKDNDCDGQIDEGLNNPPPACIVTSKKGECAKGLRYCTNGVLLCRQVNFPRGEACNNLDDDCDGQIDEGIPFSPPTCQHGTGIGSCGLGSQTCLKGQVTCVPYQAPKTETCNGLDDNCNGSTDEGNPGGGASCQVFNRKGPCAAGFIKCTSSQLRCVQTHFPQQEKCDGIDNDCSGTVDDNLTCQPNQTRCNPSNNSQFQTCNATCTSWLPPQNCPNGVCINNVCTAQGCLCTIGSQKCGPGNTILECQKVGQICEWVPTGACASPQQCQNGTPPTCQ